MLLIINMLGPVCGYGDELHEVEEVRSINYTLIVAHISHIFPKHRE